jgi:hypothetical protein
VLLRCKTSTSRSRGQIHRCRLNNRASRAGAVLAGRRTLTLQLAHTPVVNSSLAPSDPALPPYKSGTRLFFVRHAHHRPRPAPEHSVARPFAVCTRSAAHYLITLSHSPSCASQCQCRHGKHVGQTCCCCKRNHPLSRLRSSAFVFRFPSGGAASLSAAHHSQSQPKPASQPSKYP